MSRSARARTGAREHVARAYVLCCHWFYVRLRDTRPCATQPLTNFSYHDGPEQRPRLAGHDRRSVQAHTSLATTIQAT